MSYYKQTYIDDGLTSKSFNLRSHPNRMMSYRRLHTLLYRINSRGKRIPFTLRFVTAKGELVEWRDVVCTSRNIKARTHNYISIHSHNTRTVRDILVLMVDEYKITVD